MDGFPGRRLGGEFEPSQGRCRDDQELAAPRGNNPTARRLLISAFGKLAETMVIRCLGRLRSSARRGRPQYDKE